MNKINYNKNQSLGIDQKPNPKNYLFNIMTGWRGSLSAGNPKFRMHGAYDAPASERRLRRILERKARKVGTSHG